MSIRKDMHMRTLICIFILLLITVAANAHDDMWRLMKCYDGKHCRQDTLVFGVVTGLDRNSYTIDIQKVLKGERYLEKSIRIRNSKAIYRYDIDRPLKVGDALIVSFLRNDRQPFQPACMVLSKTTDWRHMIIDEASRNAFGDPCIQRFVRSGGIDDEFGSSSGKTFLIRRDGTEELIYIDPVVNIHPGKVVKLVRTSGNLNQVNVYNRDQTIIAGIAAILGLLLIAGILRSVMLRK